MFQIEKINKMDNKDYLIQKNRTDKIHTTESNINNIFYS